MNDASSVPVYDEFSFFVDNAREVGLDYPGPPVVRRVGVDVGHGQRVSALVWGHGRPEYVFIHGGAQNAHTWDTTILALGRPDAVAIDMPGHGHSDWRADQDYSPASNAAAVARAIEALAPQAHTVVGMSLGGLTSYVLAATRADLVRRLVIVDVTPGIDAQAAKRITDFTNGPAAFDSYEALLARTIEHNPGRSESSLRRGVLHNARPAGDGTWVWRYDRHSAPRDQDLGALWDHVAAIGCPIMLTIGAAWSVVDADSVTRLRQLHPSVRVEYVDGAGHSIQGDRPVELARLIADFSQRRGEPATA